MIIDFNRYNGGGSGSGVTPEQVQQQIDSALTPYWESAITESAITEAVSGLATEQYVQDALSGVSLEGYWNSAETKTYVDSGDTALQDQIDTMDEVVSEALVDLNERIDEISGSSVDLSGFYTSAQTEDAISAATSGKADAANVTARGDQFRFPYWNAQGVITGETGQLQARLLHVNGASLSVISSAGSNKDFYAPTNAGNAGNILVSTGNGAPVWSAMTFPTPDVTKAYVDSAITQVQDQLDLIDEVIPAAIVDLNEKKVESEDVKHMVKLTQAAYDQLSVKDPETFYIIINE